MMFWNSPAAALSASIALGIGLFTTPPAQAVTTFDLRTIGDNLPESSGTVDGIGLNVSNIVSQSNLTQVDPDGLCFAGAPDFFCPNTTSLKLLFDTPVRLLSYLTGFNSAASGATITFAQGSSRSVQTSFIDEAGKTFNNQFFCDRRHSN
jgi:hypothetical protein